MNVAFAPLVRSFSSFGYLFSINESVSVNWIADTALKQVITNLVTTAPCPQPDVWARYFLLQVRAEDWVTLIPLLHPEAWQHPVKAAIAQFRRIPRQAALYAVAQQRIDQAAQRILAIAHKHYQKGELEQAIRLAQATPQSSVLYTQGQEKVQQWVQVWNKDKNHFAKATQANAKPTQILKEREQIKHPYWKQKVGPLVAETQVALQSRAIQRQSAIAAIAPPTYLAHVPVLAPANDPPPPVYQPAPAPMNAAPVNTASVRSRPPASQPVTSTSASAEMFSVLSRLPLSKN